MSDVAGGLQRLGRYIVSRRVEMGYLTRTDLADVLRMNIRTLAYIEHGERRASPGSYALLEGKLGWMPGSCEAIIVGSEPRLSDNAQPARNELSHISTEELLLEIRRRIVAKPLRNGDWGGLDPLGNWPQDT